MGRELLISLGLLAEASGSRHRSRMSQLKSQADGQLNVEEKFYYGQWLTTNGLAT